MKFYRNILPVKAISFDLDDTLYDNGPIIRRAVTEQLRYLQQNIPQCADTDNKFWWSKRKQVITYKPEIESQVSNLRKQTIALGLAELGLPKEQIPTEVEKAFDHFYRMRSDFSVADETINQLLELKRKVPLVAITNGNMDIDNIGLGDMFSLVYKADDYPAKPDVAMYQHAADSLNIAPRHWLHVGDQWSTDILGARRAGFSSAFFAYVETKHNHKQMILPDVHLTELKQLSDLIHR